MDCKQEQLGQNQRISYLDVTKGLLIIMVAFSHIQWLSQSFDGSASEKWFLLNKIGMYLWVPFYMPCFFVITGFCSNFNKNFAVFLKSKIVTLLFPMLVLSFSIHWFIWSMFTAIVIYFFINKYIKTEWLKALIIILLSFLGSICASFETIIAIRRYYIFHSIGLVIFVYFGQILKRYSDKLLTNKIIIITTVFYLCVVILSFFQGYKLPAIYSKYDTTIFQWPLHIFLSTFGSLMLIGISKIISKNKVFEYLGKNSLVIFFLHFTAINLILRYCNFLFDSYWGFFVVLIMAIALCSFISYILNKPQLSWLIGKFKEKKS